MGEERVANSTAAITPTCPRCKRNSCIPLVRDADKQRFECSFCGETFWSTPLPSSLPDPGAQTSTGPRTAFVPISIPEPTAGPAGICLKCGKPYLKLGKKFEKHVAECDGKPYVAPKKRSRPVLAVPPTPSQVYELSLAAMRARKATLEAEIRGLDAAIVEVEKLQAAGGPVSAPFASGGGATP